MCELLRWFANRIKYYILLALFGKECLAVLYEYCIKRKEYLHRYGITEKTANYEDVMQDIAYLDSLIKFLNISRGLKIRVHSLH